MPFLLQFPYGSRPLRLLLTPALGSIMLTSIAAASPVSGSVTPHPWATIPGQPATAGLTSLFLVNGPVSGRVVDAKGEGMPGVTVVVAGTTLGSATNTTGEFLIADVPAGAQTLVISSVGYVTMRLPITVVDGQPTQVSSTTLLEDTQALSEVVVVGYGTQTRQELTTSVASVGAKALARQTVPSFDQALQGQAPGVQVTAPSGAPGAGMNVRIRGNNSISMSNSPLYVIDGVPVLPTYDRELSIGNQKPNPLNTINPNDIESIDVLKDGAAAAIYGLRAANGVVVITTKRGKIGKPQLGFSMYFGQQELRKKIDLLNSRQFAEYFNEARVNSGQTAPYTDLNNLPANTDWQDEMYRKAAMTSYQLNVSGGTATTRYYVSGGYLKQDGIIRNSDFDRYNFKLNLDQQAGSRFRLGTNLNLSRTHNNGSVRSEIPLGSSGTVLGALAQIPTVPVYNADGSYALNPFTLSDNPIGNLLETHNDAITYQAIGNLYGEADILPNLKFRTSFGVDFRTQLENQFISREYPGTSRSTPEQNLKGSGATGTTIQSIWLWENTLTYNPTLGDRHNLTLLAGQSVQESNRFTSSATSQGFASNASPYVSAGATRTGTNSYEEEWGLMSYFGRAIYNYDERYLATVSLRADGSSKFTEGKQFGYFPAVALGWRIAKESFFPQNTVVSDLKLRGSFGINGNQEIYAYSRFSGYDTGSNYVAITGGSIVGGIRPGRIGNLDLKWETTRQINAGLDFGLLKDRAQLTIDAYRKRTSDLLTNVPLAPSTGAQTLEVVQNLGEVENKGLEFGLTTNNVQGNEGGFSWTTNLNFTLNRNQILDYGQMINEKNQLVNRAVTDNNTIISKGQTLGAFYGHIATGIFQNADEIKNAPTQKDAKPGDVRFADINNDGVIDNNDRTVIGNPNPKSIAGVTNTFTFNGLELSVFFQGSFGNDIQNLNRQTIEGAVGAVNQSTAVLNRWTPTNTNTNIPRAAMDDPNQNNRFSTRFVEDGSYVRLKNLTLAYNIPTTLLQKAHFSGLRLYVTGQNLLTWTDYSGYDPEVSADPFSSTTFGRDFGTYPQARTYTIGLNASF